MMLITENCRDWLRTVPYLTSDPRNPEDIDTELEDHAFDETKYAAMSEYALNPRSLARRETLSPIRAKRREFDPLRAGL